MTFLGRFFLLSNQMIYIDHPLIKRGSIIVILLQENIDETHYLLLFFDDRLRFFELFLKMLIFLIQVIKHLVVYQIGVRLLLELLKLPLVPLLHG